MVTGQTLIDLGYKPSKWFKNVIDYANTNNLESDAIHRYIDSIVPKTLEPHSQPISFHKNIIADNQYEQSNIDSVCAAMNNILTIPTVVNAAIMPDACPTGPNDIPVGGIVATKNAIHPSMHSADICCSVMCSNLGKMDPKSVLDNVCNITNFGIGGRANYTTEKFLPEHLKEKFLDNEFLKDQKTLFLAETHLLTSGNGNHFIFVGKSKSNGNTYLVSHFGSRGVGSRLYIKGKDIAEKFRKEISPLSNTKNAWIPYDTLEGQNYWDALQIIREWTKLNHKLLHSLVSSFSEKNTFWNEHNFVFKKNDLFYHAKGATPLSKDFVPDSLDGLRLVPMNMRDGILIVRGEETETNLGFCNHGAGRLMSRTEYTKQALANKTGHELFLEETAGLDIRFFTGKMDISELPGAYKSAEIIQKQMKQFDLGEIIDIIEPYGCIMCGHDKYDWKNKRKS